MDKMISIIIVNYNTSSLTLDCIRSVRQQTHDVDYEIIVIDNASPSDSHLSELESLDGILFVQSKENLGFGRANNLGLEYAKGEYIFLLNSDTLFLNNALKYLLDYAEGQDGTLGAIGGILENSTGEPVHSSGSFPTILSEYYKLTFKPLLSLLKGKRTIKQKTVDTAYEVDYVTGADLFVKRSVLNACGAFNPAFFMYYEETEMQYRFSKNGYHNYIIPGPRIIHYEGESAKHNGTSQFLRDCLRQLKSMYIYYRLTEPYWKYLSFRIIYPILRQTLWLNPRVSLSDKKKVMKQLFVTIES